MQVNNRIQSNNYNASFGRPGAYRMGGSSNEQVRKIVNDYSRSSNKSTKELVESLIDKLDRSEIRELAEKLEKKTKEPNIDNTWF